MGIDDVCVSPPTCHRPPPHPTHPPTIQTLDATHVRRTQVDKINTQALNTPHSPLDPLTHLYTTRPLETKSRPSCPETTTTRDSVSLLVRAVRNHRRHWPRPPSHTPSLRSPFQSSRSSRTRPRRTTRPTSSRTLLVRPTFSTPLASSRSPTTLRRALRSPSLARRLVHAQFPQANDTASGPCQGS